jgi:gliding motility-associated-like protein
MTVTDGHGCSTTVTKPAYIDVGTLVASFTYQPVCEDTLMTFTSTATNASATSWDFGDGGTASGTNPTHLYTTPGVYNVKQVVYNSTCKDSVIIPVTVHAKPNVNFTISPNPPCPGPVSIQYVNQTTGGSTYWWTINGGGTSTAVSPTFVRPSGYDTTTLIAVSAFGCRDTIEKIHSIVNMVLVPKATPNQGCVPLLVTFDSDTLSNNPLTPAQYPFAISTWHWDFGDGTTAFGRQPPPHLYSNTGTYIVTHTVTTVYGCVVVDTIHIRVGVPPTASFSASPTTVCVGQGVTFINTSTNATYYLWDFGDNVHSMVPSLTHIYNVNGIFSVTLHAFNNGCEDSVRIDSMILVHPPTAAGSYLYSCDTPLLVKFFDTACIGATSHIWYFGDNTSSTASNPTHTYPSLGVWPVTLVTFNNVSGCSDTLSDTIRLIDPVASFFTPDTAICIHDSITFFASYTGIATQYEWWVDNTIIYPLIPPPKPPQSPNPKGYRFHNGGLYTITVIISDAHMCPDTARRTNYILVADPVGDFTGVPVSGCVPLNVQFTENSANTQGAFSAVREWDFGNGNNATVSSASTNNIYNTAGLFNVRLIVTDNVGCKDTIVKNNYIQAVKPKAQFASSTLQACKGQNINFVNQSTGNSLSFNWDFGDGTTSTMTNPIKIYAATGSYTIRLIVTDATGCKDTAIAANHILISSPTAAFSMSDSMAICPPLNVLFTNQSAGATSYAWEFGNSTTSVLTNPSAIYTTSGLFTIRLIAKNSAGCPDTTYRTANVLGHAGNLSYSPLIGCVPLTVNFTANLNNVPSMIWDFNDGVTQPANGSSTATHVYQTPGLYIPKLIFSDGAGCLNSSTGMDTIKVDGVLPGFTMVPPCEKTLVQFQDTSFSFFSPITSWYWSFDNGQSTSTLSNPTKTYPTAGKYNVLLVATNGNGCFDTLDKEITIFPLPTISAGLDTIICPGDPAQLFGSGGVSYVWTPTNQLSCANCQSPVASPTVNTRYIVTGTDQYGCKNNDSVEVKMQYVTTSKPGDGGEICDDSTFQLSASGAQRYEWKPTESLHDSKVANPLATPHVTTIYTVTAWEGSCPPDSHKVRVVVHPKPIVDAGSDETIVAGAQVMLNATGSNIVSYQWSPPSTLSCEICTNPMASPKVTTKYKVLATSNRGCKSVDTVTVHVICDNSQLFIPNYFSPNGDGNNDAFYPRGEGLKIITVFKVYNRWGALLFERNNIGLNDASSAWDGTYKSAQLSPDVFVYLIQGICESGETLTWKGDVTLSR